MRASCSLQHTQQEVQAEPGTKCTPQVHFMHPLHTGTYPLSSIRACMALTSSALRQVLHHALLPVHKADLHCTTKTRCAFTALHRACIVHKRAQAAAKLAPYHLEGSLQRLRPGQLARPGRHAHAMPLLQLPSCLQCNHQVTCPGRPSMDVLSGTLSQLHKSRTQRARPAAAPAPAAPAMQSTHQDTRPCLPVTCVPRHTQLAALACAARTPRARCAAAPAPAAPVKAPTRIPSRRAGLCVCSIPFS